MNFLSYTMIKYSVILRLALVASATLMSSASGESDATWRQKAKKAVEAAIPKAEKDPYRPVFHFRPPAQWMNDVCGTIFHKGYYHLSYLINPFGDRIASMEVWGHARSKDMVHWEHLPIPVWPCGEPWEDAIYTGGAAINRHGRPMFFWTANPRRGSGLRRTVGAAISDDAMIHWKKIPGNPIMSRGTHDDPEFGGGWDAPFLFTEKGRTFVIFGAHLSDESVVPIYEALNPELTRWTYRGILFRVPKREVSDMECVNFVRLGDRWMLCYSPDNKQMRYHVGVFDSKTMTFTPQVDGILDHAFGRATGGLRRGFYASNILYAPDGRSVIFAWVSGFRSHGWNGCVSLPRVLTLGPDGHPRQAPAVELKKLRGAHSAVKKLKLSSKEERLKDIAGDTMEIVAEFKAGDAKAFGLKLRQSDDGKNAITIRYTNGKLNVAGTDVPLKLVSGKLKLHVFIDKSVLEVFVNDGVTSVTRVEYPGENDLGVSVFAENGSATLTSLDAWQMKSIW